VRSTLWTARRGAVIVEVVQDRNQIPVVDTLVAISFATFENVGGWSTPIKIVDQEDHVFETDALILVYVFRESSVRSQGYPEIDSQRRPRTHFFLDNRTAG